MLTCCNQELTTGVDVERSCRWFAGGVAKCFQEAIILIDRKTSDTVMPAIGDVDKFPGGMNLDVRCAACLGVIVIIGER